MEYPTRPLTHHNGLFFHTLVRTDTRMADVLRLRHEKDILEDGLADCITYLQALRKKYARNERQLHHDPLPPRKKRKKIQQRSRELSKAIKNRERDEQAFLNNLRACKANLYITEELPYAPADCSPTSTLEDLESKDFGWSDWAGRSDVSPFTRPHDATEFMEDVSADELNGIPDNYFMAVPGARQLPPLHRRSVSEGALPCWSQPSLGHNATAFAPSVKHGSKPASQPRHHIDKLNDLSWLDTKIAQAMSTQTTREADMTISMQNLAIQPTRDIHQRGSHTWCNTSPEHSPHEATASTTLGRARTNSI